MNKIVKCFPFTNVVATGLAICDLSNLLGSTIETIDLDLGGTTFTKAMMTSIQLKANGKVIIETTGSACDSRQQFRGHPASASKLTIDLTEAKARTVAAFQSGALDTSAGSGIAQLRLEVQITGATAPTLAATAQVSPPQNAPEQAAYRDLIARVHRVTQTIGGAGEFPLAVPHLDPAGGGSVYKRIVVYTAQGNAFKVIRNGQTDFEATKAQNEWAQQRAGRTPQTNIIVIDPILDNMQSGRVLDTRPSSGVQSAQVLMTFAAGETITIETEELIPLQAY